MQKETNIILQQVHQVLRCSQVPAGTLVLTDRLWPRGIKKIDLKNKNIIWYNKTSPSTQLRRSFHAEKISEESFNQAYQKQLLNEPELLAPLLIYLEKGPLTLLTAMREPEKTYLMVLKKTLLQQIKHNE